MKKIIILSFLSLFLLKNSYAQSMTCKDLVEYRNHQLVSDFDKAVKKYTVARESLSFLQDVKNESLQLRKSQPMINQAFQLTLSLKTVADTISDLLKINPQTGLAIGGIQNGSIWAESIINTSTAVNLSNSLKDEKVGEYLTAEIISQHSSIGAAVSSAYNLSKNIKEQYSEYKDGQEILNIIDQNILVLEKQIKKLEEQVNSNSLKINTINSIKKKIDSQCGFN